MLGHPQAAIAPGLGMGSEVARIVEGAAGIGLFGDAGKLEDRQYRHGRQSPTATPQPAQAAGASGPPPAAMGTPSDRGRFPATPTQLAEGAGGQGGKGVEGRLA